MVIWRGWGVLAIVYAGAAMILFTGVGSTVLPENLLPYSAAVGLLLAAIATWFTGNALNRSTPQHKIALWEAERNLELVELVETGRFSLGPGQPQPSSQEEAEDMADALFDAEKAEVRKHAFNRHTMFWIPMQYFAFVWGTAALAAVVSGVVKA